MSAILEGTPDKRLALVTGRAYPELANEVAQYLGINVLPTTAYDFANGEMYVRFAEPVRGADVFVLQCHTNPINKWVMEQLLMIDALKRASAKSITVVAPFLGYSRQDKKHQGREPITARLMFDLFRTAGVESSGHRRPACRAGAGLLRRPGRPFDRHARADRLRAQPRAYGQGDDRLPRAGRIKVSEQWAAKLAGSRSRSSTRLATSRARTMPKRMASSATCRVATAWWWTT